MKTLFNALKFNKAISLLETVLTLTLLAISASVVLPVSKIYIVQQREETLKKNLNNIREAIDNFKKEKKCYPGSIDELLESRYLRRLDPEPFGNKWQYRPNTDVYEWKDFETGVNESNQYLATVKNVSMKAQKSIVKMIETSSLDMSSAANADESASVELDAKGETKEKSGKDTLSVTLTKEVETYVYEEIYDIRSSTDYTGFNGVPYNQW